MVLPYGSVSLCSCLVWHWASRGLAQSYPLTQGYAFTERLYSIQQGLQILCLLESSGGHLKTQIARPTLRILRSVVSGLGSNNLHL